MNIAIIPARGQSKRIPRKNIKLMLNKPIITWVIEKALDSNTFDEIIVSTDDEEIAEISKNCGAKIPFLRPGNLSDDYVGIIDVIVHSINKLNYMKSNQNFFCCLLPTSIFFTKEDLILGYNKVKHENWKFSFSASQFHSSIYRSFKLTNNGGVEMIFPDKYQTRTQDLQKCFYDAAQFYWGKNKSWLEENILFGSNSYPVIIPNNRVIDIDNETDWKLAEELKKKLLKNN